GPAPLAVIVRKLDDVERRLGVQLQQQPAYRGGVALEVEGEACVVRVAVGVGAEDADAGEQIGATVLQALVSSGNHRDIVAGGCHGPRHLARVGSDAGPEEGGKLAADEAVAHGPGSL